MVIKYQFFKEKGLLVKKYTGIWSLEEYKDQYQIILGHSDFKHVEKVLSDVTEINLESAYKELESLVAFREFSIKSKYFNVHLISNPANTAVIHLYHRQLREKGFDYEYCSTLEKALILLNLPYSSFEMDQMIENLNLEVKINGKSK